MAHRPVQRMDDYPLGDFSFINDLVKREMYTHDYKLINNTPGLLKYLKDQPIGIPMLFDNIFPNLIKNSWNKHTISTFGKSMCVMRSIAKLGWEDFVFLMRD